MPLIFKYNSDLHNSKIGVWENTENDDFFIKSLKINAEDYDNLLKLKAHRRKEWLCSRFLIKHLMEHHPCDIIKDTYGKPYVENNPCHISISHSKNRVAAIISDVAVGIDIQKTEDKIARIHKKFISENEILRLDQNNLNESFHIFWGAKESMYKAWGKRELDFRTHMHLYPFVYFQHNLELVGHVRKSNYHLDFKIFTDKIDDYFLVYAINI